VLLLSRVGHILGTLPSTKRARWWPVGLLAIWAVSTSIPLCTGNEPRAEEPSETKPISAVAESTGSAYNHFLYVRHNEENGSVRSNTLVLVKVTPKRLQRRYLYIFAILFIS
jgi:hypothetical protein